MTIDGGMEWVNASDTCPGRGVGLSHTADYRQSPDGRCLYCQRRMSFSTRTPPPPPPPPPTTNEGRPIDPARPLIERLIELRHTPASEREAGWIGREGDLWEGHRVAADAAASIAQQAINQVAQLQPIYRDGAQLIERARVLEILGRPTSEQSL